MEWVGVNGLFTRSLPLANAVKIAAFDLDSTLVVPKDPKAKFATSRDDWRWWHPSVPVKLKQLHADGYLVVIMSNQSGVAKGTTNIKDITGKIEDMSKELGFELAATIACNHDVYRKPCVGMWKHLVGPEGSAVNSSSWYV